MIKSNSSGESRPSVSSLARPTGGMSRAAPAYRRSRVRSGAGVGSGGVREKSKSSEQISQTSVSGLASSDRFHNQLTSPVSRLFGGSDRSLRSAKKMDLERSIGIGDDIESRPLLPPATGSLSGKHHGMKRAALVGQGLHSMSFLYVLFCYVLMCQNE